MAQQSDGEDGGGSPRVDGSPRPCARRRTAADSPGSTAVAAAPAPVTEAEAEEAPSSASDGVGAVPCPAAARARRSEGEEDGSPQRRVRRRTSLEAASPVPSPPAQAEAREARPSECSPESFWSQSALASALCSADVAAAVAWPAGSLAACALRATSRSVGRVIADILPATLERCFVGLCVCGGTDGQSFTPTAEVFEPWRGRWRALPAMPQGRLNASAAALSGRLWVCGGVNTEEVGSLRSGVQFDALASTWEDAPPMARRRRATAAAVLGGRLYVCGGAVDGSVERFDPRTGAWEVLPPTPERHGGFVVAAVVGERLYLCGGMWQGVYLRTVSRFDPGANAWEALPPMLVGRNSAVAAGMAGELYVCGGISIPEHHVGGCRTSCDLRSAERLRDGQWEPLPHLQTPRAGAAGAALARRFYVCGGACEGEVLSSVEAFSLDSGAWETIAPMSRPRRFAAAGAVVI